MSICLEDVKFFQDGPPRLKPLGVEKSNLYKSQCPKSPITSRDASSMPHLRCRPRFRRRPTPCCKWERIYLSKKEKQEFRTFSTENDDSNKTHRGFFFFVLVSFSRTTMPPPIII